MRRNKFIATHYNLEKKKNSIFLYKFRQNNKRYILISAKLLFLTIDHTLQFIQHITVICFLIIYPTGSTSQIDALDLNQINHRSNVVLSSQKCIYMILLKSMQSVYNFIQITYLVECKVGLYVTKINSSTITRKNNAVPLRYFSSQILSEICNTN